MIIEIKTTIVSKKTDSKPIYNKNFPKTKTKSSGDEALNFHDKEIPKIDPSDICLVIMLIGFVLKKDRTYYTQVSLKECF